MESVIKSFDWLTTLPTSGKVLLSLVIVILAAFALVMMWQPPAGKSTAAAAIAAAPASAGSIGIGRPPAEPPKPAATSGPFSTLDTYSARLNEVYHRFGERDKLFADAVGQVISWEGRVATVFGDGPEPTPIWIAVSNTNKRHRAIVRMPETFRARAYGLAVGDLVRFRGIVHTADELSIRVTGHSVEWVAPAPKSP
jgi:hypothetical protein